MTLMWWLGLNGQYIFNLFRLYEVVYPLNVMIYDYNPYKLQYFYSVKPWSQARYKLVLRYKLSNQI